MGVLGSFFDPHSIWTVLRIVFKQIIIFRRWILLLESWTCSTFLKCSPASINPKRSWPILRNYYLNICSLKKKMEVCFMDHVPIGSHGVYIYILKYLHWYVSFMAWCILSNQSPWIRSFLPKAQQSHEAILDASTLLEAEPGEQGRGFFPTGNKMVEFQIPLKPLVGRGI